MMLTAAKYLVGFALIFAGLVAAARILFPLPAPPQEPASTALPPAADNPLLAAIAPMAKENPDKTGIYPLISGLDAFVARMLLTEQARSSIDVQYYIWHDDLTGTVLLDALKAAAMRGVRVRLLLDDNGIDALDAELAALDRLPNMEVRLFNPFVLRRPKVLNYAFDFFRLNHRMHNKSFTVDMTASVIGGRNVGDEYFGTGPNGTFLDLDVLAVGEVVPKISADFDLYWSSPAAYPIASIVGEDGGDGLEKLAASVARVTATEQFEDYRKEIEGSGLVRRLLDRSLRLEWTDVQLVSDDPAKVLRKARRRDLMLSRLNDLLETPTQSLDLVSAYFVPGKIGMRKLTELEKKNVRVRILTNGFEATDVALVHSGYAKYRRKLLDFGVDLFELKARAAPQMGREELGVVGSSGSSLHAKTFSIDGRHVFVGSFNFDPRSALLNTEMGLMIDSPTLARGINDLFDTGLPGISYRTTLTGDGRIAWTDIGEDGEPQVHDVEPGTTFLSRLLVRVTGWLPVEWML
jgi:Phosphatidylserine/phosphatidylglycerophosphate/cardiolipin synthases and related enzymes